MPTAPSLRRRRFAAELRKLREQSGLGVTDVAKLLEYLLSDSPRARSSPTLAIPPTLLARADEVTE